MLLDVRKEQESGGDQTLLLYRPDEPQPLPTPTSVDGGSGVVTPSSLVPPQSTTARRASVSSLPDDTPAARSRRTSTASQPSGTNAGTSQRIAAANFAALLSRRYSTLAPQPLEAAESPVEGDGGANDDVFADDRERVYVGFAAAPNGIVFATQVRARGGEW